jgi:hypothetical protein
VIDHSCVAFRSTANRFAAVYMFCSCYVDTKIFTAFIKYAMKKLQSLQFAQLEKQLVKARLMAW